MQVIGTFCVIPEKLTTHLKIKIKTKDLQLDESQHVQQIVNRNII